MVTLLNLDRNSKNFRPGCGGGGDSSDTAVSANPPAPPPRWQPRQSRPRCPRLYRVQHPRRRLPLGRHL